MAGFPWREFLMRRSRELLQNEKVRKDQRGLLSSEAVASGWLGYPGATEEQIKQAEVRLGTTFPPSYRQFLAVSNGWSVLTHFIDHLWSTDKIEWLSTRRQDLVREWVEMDETCPDDEYLDYNDDGVALSDCLRTEYMETALEISDVAYGDTAICFLNPRIITREGEWEAWFHAHWLPGAIRYQSFWDLVQDQCKTDR